MEWDFEYFNPKGSRTLVGAYAGDGVPFTFTQGSSGSWLSTLRGRIGMAQNNWLLYLTGGVAAAQLGFNSTFQDQETSPPRASGGLASAVSISQTRYGAVGGAGFEYGFAPNWSVRAEYLYLVIDRLSTNTTALPTNGSNVGTCTSFCSLFALQCAVRRNDRPSRCQLSLRLLRPRVGCERPKPWLGQGFSYFEVCWAERGP